MTSFKILRLQIFWGLHNMDANLMYFPIAYAIVEIENGETWDLFFNILKDIVGQYLERKT